MRDVHEDDDLWVDSDETWLSVKEVAARWRVSRMKVYRMCESAELKSHRFGRSWRITLSDVQQYEEGSVFVPETEEATG